MDKNKQTLWIRWTTANALAEMVGLGATFATIGLLLTKIDGLGTTTGIVLSFVIAVISSSVEATIVGLDQWWVLQSWFPQV
jgi:hypothetical protein